MKKISCNLNKIPSTKELEKVGEAMIYGFSKGLNSINQILKSKKIIKKIEELRKELNKFVS